MVLVCSSHQFSTALSSSADFCDSETLSSSTHLLISAVLGSFHCCNRLLLPPVLGSTYHCNPMLTPTMQSVISSSHQCCCQLGPNNYSFIFIHSTVPSQNEIKLHLIWIVPLQSVTSNRVFKLENNFQCQVQLKKYAEFSLSTLTSGS